VSSPRNSADRFFHAMVLMGGSLALGCGGATTQDPAAAGGSTAGGTTGKGGTPNSGGTPGSGGASGGGSGGSIIVVGNGGAAVTPGPFDCPPAQWDCSAHPPWCSGRTYALPDNCACDPARPLTSAACASGEDWVCRSALEDSHGNYFTQEVPFECSCAPHQTNCRPVCDQVFQDTGQCRQTGSGGATSVLCDCAVIVLR